MTKERRRGWRWIRSENWRSGALSCRSSLSSSSQSMTMAGRIRSGDAVLEIFFNMLQGHDPMIRGLKSPPHWFVRVTIREIMKLWQTVFILMMCGWKDSRMASLFLPYLPLLFYFSELCFLTSPRAHTDCVERKDSPAILITRGSDSSRASSPPSLTSPCHLIIDTFEFQSLSCCSLMGEGEGEKGMCLWHCPLE
jgi:hypothetical protein